MRMAGARVEQARAAQPGEGIGTHSSETEEKHEHGPMARRARAGAPGSDADAPEAKPSSSALLRAGGIRQSRLSAAARRGSEARHRQTERQRLLARPNWRASCSGRNSKQPRGRRRPQQGPHPLPLQAAARAGLRRRDGAEQVSSVVPHPTRCLLSKVKRQKGDHCGSGRSWQGQPDRIAAAAQANRGCAARCRAAEHRREAPNAQRTGSRGAGSALCVGVVVDGEQGIGCGGA